MLMLLVYRTFSENLKFNALYDLSVFPCGTKYQYF